VKSERAANLEPRLVGDISEMFYVPAYQRGYRWGAVEVRKLLDDIWVSRDKPYYLQPVVVKQHGDEWELVDGQQRLTTLFLIFQYMKREGLQSLPAGYSLRYETRPGSAAYLEQLDSSLSQENIDFFHIHEAYRCISEWFDAHGPRRQHAANKFYGALFEQVRVIWYEAAGDLDAVTLFTRLNVGRIPLTDAELVKALLLSRSRSDAGLTDRALEQLNRAEQWEEWLRLHRKALTAFDDVDQVRKKAVLDRVEEVLANPPVKEADFRPLERELAELLSTGSDTADGALDSIANLALLPGGDNSALGNSVFAVKRAAILEHDRRGSYIPICTRNVFLKYYSPADEQQMHFWSATDREHYLRAMADILRGYLRPDKETAA
jgi:Protein of unknown function DUF262